MRPPAATSMAKRRIEDERYAYFAEVSLVFLDLPDAVFRGYEGDDQLLGAPRADDESPFELLRREIARLEPQHVYLPLAVGGHVDHRLCRDAGVASSAKPASWVMPGPEYAGMVELLRGLPVRLVGRFPGPRRSRAGAVHRSAVRCQPRARSTPTSATSSNARSPASRSTEARSIGCSRTARRWRDAIRGVWQGDGRPRRHRRAAERYWVTRRV